MRNPPLTRVLLPAIAAGLLALPATAAAAPASGIIDAFAGNGVQGYTGDGGPATAAQLNFPTDAAELTDGSVVVTDQSANVVRKVAPDGTISTVVGNGVACPAPAGGCGDGGAASAAQLNAPTGIAATGDGGYLIADMNDFRIRKVDAGGTISTVAGTGVQCTPATCGATDGGPATSAQLDQAGDIAPMADGGFVIADLDANVVRRVDATAKIFRAAGNYTAGFSGDGALGSNAQLNNPYSVSATADGGYLIADSANHRIRKIDAAGNISTVAGSTALGGFGGDGGPATAAQLNGPQGVVAASDGGFYIGDTANSRVRAVDPAGTIRTFAGNGGVGNTGDGGPATAAQLSVPWGLAIGTNSVLIADPQTSRVRWVGLTPQAGGAVTPPAGTGGGAAGGTQQPPLIPPTGVAPAEVGRSVIAVVTRGTVRVRLKGQRAFTLLTDATNLPIGTEFDTTKGSLVLFFATGRDDPHSVEISSGLFRTRQSTRTGSVLEADLTAKLKGCPSVRRARRAATALAARASTRKIKVKAKGPVKSKGRYGSAIVRGTAWTIRDTCNVSRDGTLVSVTEGLVGVTDFAKRKTVLVPRGKRYFAAARPKR